MKTKALLCLLLTFVVSIPVVSQQPQPQKPKPTVPNQEQPQEEQDQEVVRISTNLVQLDAVVTKEGKVVTDLTPNDFVITEDGKPQSITHFSYVSNVRNSENSVAQPAPWSITAVIDFEVIKSPQPKATIETSAPAK